MKKLLVIEVLLLKPVQPLYGSTLQASGKEATTQAEAKTLTPEARKRDLEEFMFMREFWFQMKPHEVQIAPTAEFPKVFSVIMDWPIQSKSSEVIQVLVGAVADGTSSLYICSGPTVLGGHSAKEQAQAAIKAAEGIYQSAEPVTSHPLPPTDEVYFYIRTYNDLLVLRDKQSDLLNGRGNTFQLFVEMNKIISTHLDTIEKEPEPKLGLDFKSSILKALQRTNSSP